MRGSLSGTLATMGPGVPYAHRRQVRPPGPAGDRVRRRRRDADERHGRADHRSSSTGSSGRTRGWSSPSCTTTTSTRSPGRCGRWAARPKFAESQALPDVDYAGFAAQPRAARRSRSTEPDEVAAAWEQALAADRPTVLDVRTRPRRAADPAARHLRADEGRRRGDAQGRRRPVGRHQGGHQDQGPGVPAAPEDGRRWRARRRPVSVASRSRAYTVPTDAPEADGTLRLGRHHLVLVTGSVPADTVGHRLDLRPARPAPRSSPTSSPASSTGRDAMRRRRPLRRHGPGRAQRRPAGGGRVRASRRSTSRCGTSRRGCSACRCTGCSAPSAARSRSTAAAASPPTTSRSCRAAEPLGASSSASRG